MYFLHPQHPAKHPLMTNSYNCWELGHNIRNFESTRKRGVRCNHCYTIRLIDCSSVSTYLRILGAYETLISRPQNKIGTVSVRSMRSSSVAGGTRNKLASNICDLRYDSTDKIDPDHSIRTRVTAKWKRLANQQMQEPITFCEFKRNEWK